MKKVFFFALVLLLILPLASAYVLPSAQFSGDNSNVTIRNWFGFGGDVAHYSLDYSTDQCLVNCESGGQVHLFENMPLFDLMQFKDEQGNSELIDARIYYSTNESYRKQLDNWTEYCTNDPASTNGTMICDAINNPYSIFDYHEVWHNYNGETLDAGYYGWKIVGKKNPLDSIDWVGTVAGQRLDAWAWWNNSWSYQKQLNITETSGVGQTNYSVLVNVTYSNHMNVDFSDLRFINSSDNASISYWIINKTNSSYALVWLKVPSLPASGVTEVDMYYGNAAATTTASNITNAFAVGGTGLDGITPGYTAVYGGVFNKYTRNGIDYIMINTSSSASFSLAGLKWASPNLLNTKWEGLAWISSYNATMSGSSFGVSSASGTCTNCMEGIAFARDSGGGSSPGGYVNGNVAWNGGTTYPTYSVGTDVISKVIVVSNTSNYLAHNETFVYVNGTEASVGNVGYTAAGTEAKFPSVGNFGNVQGTIFRFFYFRNVAATEPTSAFGPELSLNGATIVLVSPTNVTNATNPTINFTCNATVIGGLTTALTNLTLYTYGPVNLTNNTLVTGASNQTSWLNYMPDGIYQWNCRAGGNDGSNTFALYNNTLTVDNTTPQINITRPINNDNYYGNYIAPLNFTAVDPTAGVQTCKYSLNGNANITIASCANTTMTFSQMGNQSVRLWVNDTMGNLATQQTNFSVWPNFMFCNASQNVSFVNYVFKDELTGNYLNGLLGSSTWNYWDTQNGSALNQTYSYSNSTMVNNFSFCNAPSWDPSITVSPNILYSSTSGGTYPQRNYAVYNQTYTNTTQNVSLYLLASTSGQYVTFQVIDASLKPISTVEVTAVTTIGGSSVTIGHGFTDASGVLTLWMNPLASHTITFQKTGYTTYTTTITPSQTSYTISLQTVGGSNATDPTQGVKYYFLPANTYLSNSTIYSFSFNVSDSVNTITAWGYNVTNSSGSLILSNSSSANGGLMVSQINTSSNKTLVMNANYTVNLSGTLTTMYVTKIWVITPSGNTSYSINYLLNDFKTYTTTGTFFGLDSFGITMIVFLIIFSVTGVLSYKFGIYSPAALSFIIAAQTAFFDVGLGLVTPPPFVSAIPNFATIVTIIIFFALAIKEGTSY